jgi:hypothetical protein
MHRHSDNPSRNVWSQRTKGNGRMEVEGGSCQLGVSKLHIGRWLELGKDMPGGGTYISQGLRGKIKKDMNSLLLLTPTQSVPNPGMMMPCILHRSPTCDNYTLREDDILVYKMSFQVNYFHNFTITSLLHRWRSQLKEDSRVEWDFRSDCHLQMMRLRPMEGMGPLVRTRAKELWGLFTSHIEGIKWNLSSYQKCWLQQNGIIWRTQ